MCLAAYALGTMYSFSFVFALCKTFSFNTHSTLSCQDSHFKALNSVCTRVLILTDHVLVPYRIVLAI